MKKSIIVFNVLLLLLSFSTFASSKTLFDPPFINRPCISADGSMITFEYGGDIWVCSSEGGVARRLTVHMASETRPYFSPDGMSILYSADYYGSLNLYIMPVEGGTPKRLTFGAFADIPSGWSSDGKYVYFYSNRNLGMDSYRVPATGGTPTLIAEAYIDGVYSPSPSPDGSKVAFSYRSSLGERNRYGYENYATAEIYIADNTTPATNLKRITNNLFQDFIPQWSADGKYIYYMSDASGSYNIYRYSIRGAFRRTRKITKIKKGIGIRWLSVSASGKAIVLYNHKLHHLNLEKGGLREISVELYTPQKFETPEIFNEKVKVTDFEVSPDGKKVVFISGHDVFIMATTGGYTKPLTKTTDRELNLSWAPDSRHILFNRIFDQAMNIVRLDIVTGKEEYVTTGPENRFNPIYTPDGNRIAYQRNFDAICSCDSDGKDEKVLVEGVFTRRLLQGFRRFDFSDDGKWIIYTINNDIMQYNPMVKKLGDDSPGIDMCPLGGYAYPAGFTADYKHFLFSVSDMGRVISYVVDFTQNTKVKKGKKQILDELLAPKKPKKKPEKGEKPKAKDDEKKKDKSGPKPGDTLDTSDLINKVRPLSPYLTSSNYVIHITKRGSAIVAVEVNGVFNVYAVPISNLAPPRPPMPLTRAKDGIDSCSLDKAEKNIYFVSNGQLYHSALGSTRATKLTPSALRFNRPVKSIRQSVLKEAIWLMRWGFYEETLHGVDIEEIEARYAKLVDQTVSDSNMQTLMWDYIGEYDASHMMFNYKGHEPQGGTVTENTPYLGFIYDDSLIEQGLLRVKHLIFRTPASQPNSGLKVGDYIHAINGKKFGVGVNVYELLRNAGSEEIELLISDSPEATNTRLVYLTPISTRSFYVAKMAEWEEMNRKYVEEKTDGKFGYIYLASMLGNDSVKFRIQLSRYMDGYDGVVLDFRYNAGGYIAFSLAEVLDNKPWMFSRLRGGSWVPENVLRSFGYQKATCGMFNYGSYSNAEMMASAYRLLDLGPSVGMPTAGAVIGVHPVDLVDGSVMNLPQMKVVDGNGRNMERSPTEPEYIVDETVDDEMNGRQPQLDRAIIEVIREARKNKSRFQPKIRRRR